MTLHLVKRLLGNEFNYFFLIFFFFCTFYLPVGKVLQQAKLKVNHTYTSSQENT